MKWSDDLRIGIPEIDVQHQEIFRRVEALLEACQDGRGQGQVHDTLLFLQRYVKEHFAAEEKLQRDFKFPGYAAHKREHAQFLRDVYGLVTQFEDEGATLPLVLAVKQLVVGWLYDHIATCDQEIAAHVRKASAAAGG